MKKYIQLHNRKQTDIIGKIIYTFNGTENCITNFLSTLFVSLETTQERAVLMNDVLNNLEIFERFNQKINFLQFTVKRIDFVAKNNNLEFPTDKYLKICKEIKEAQKLRNKVAHSTPSFISESLVTFVKRKTNKELLIEKTGSLKYEEVDLQGILLRVEEIHQKTEEILKPAEALNVLFQAKN